jgi:TolB-like protein
MDHLEDVTLPADVYDRDVKDIFAVEDEIAGAIVRSVTPKAGRSAASQDARNN